MSDTTFLEGNALWREIRRLSALKSRGPAYLAVAYIGKSAPDLLALRRGDHLVADVSKESLQSSQTHPDAIQTFIQRGVIVHSRPNLHAKVYVFGRTAIVSSANVSEHSQGTLLEAGFKSTEKEAVAASRAFVADLEVEHELIDLRRIRQLSPFYRPPTYGASVPRVRGFLPVSGASTHRVGVVGFETYSPTESENKVIRQTRNRARRTAGPAATIEVESFTWRGNLDVSEYDFLIHVGGDDKEANWMTYPPAEVIRIDPVSAGRHICWLARPRTLAPVKWQRFSESARSARAPLDGSSLRNIAWLPLQAVEKIVTANWPRTE